MSSKKAFIVTIKHCPKCLFFEMARQTTFSNVSDEFKGYWKSTDRPFHGGAYAMGKRKTRRPYDSKRPIHLVLRSKRARGELSMLRFRNRNHIHNLVHR